MSFNYRIDLSYKGTNYNGWQSQADKGAVQDHVEAVLAQILNQPIRLTGASRTDSGVHALHQVATFKTQKELDLFKTTGSMRALLPHDIRLQNLTQCPDSFNPIRDAQAKLYRYRLWTGPYIDAFNAEQAWQIKAALDIGVLRRELHTIVGEHDFVAFCASGSSAKTTVREILDAWIVRKGSAVDCWFLGRGFLKQMVRSLVGTLVGVAVGKKTPGTIAELLVSKDRVGAGPTAPACGLTLVKIFYLNPPGYLRP